MEKTFEMVLSQRPNNFVNIWHVEGYAGFDDCDGACDYNRHYVIAVDNRFTKEDLEAMFFKEFEKYRSVELKLTWVRKMEINIPIK